MAVLILKNIVSEGPGTIEDFLKDNCLPYKIIELSGGDSIPDTADFDTLIMLGGPMSVNEGEIYPYIQKEEKLVRDFIKDNKRILGICLGAQIIAKALGAAVYKGKEPEIGWYDIELQENGLRDSLIGRLAIHPRAGDYWKRFKVFHWHGETFDLPAGAERIASSAMYRNQAFRFGDKVYGFQFHIEVKKETICEWLKNEPVDLDRIKKETESYYEDYLGRAYGFYKAFFPGKD